MFLAGGSSSETPFALMLLHSLRTTTHRLLPRSPALLRTMSSIYVLPIDPNAPASTSASSAGVDAAKLWQTTPAAAKPASVGTTHLFFGAGAEGATAAVSSLGDKFAQKKCAERREAVRRAVGSAVKKVRDLGEGVQGSDVRVDASADPHAAGTSSLLVLSSALSWQHGRLVSALVLALTMCDW